ncbi:MAG: hypothetical protein M3Q30_25560 [Actinomycetota bacterium]|nr:hypothetical protein [Actinomycetota bacterium]
MRTRPRDEDGSIVLVVLSAMIVTMLVVSILATVTDSLKFSRRSGDSANALQLADAGINDAIQTLPAQVGPTYNSGGCASPCAVTLGSAGSYQYTATIDPAATIWHITSWGTDAHGQMRKIRADASAESLFGTAFFIYANANLGQGTLDSFTDGVSKQDMCTFNGVLSSNSGGTWFGTNGNGNKNCQNYTYGNGWNSAVDGCELFSKATPPPALPTTGSGQCPASQTKLIPHDFSPPQVTSPGGGGPFPQPAVCDGVPGHSSLKAQANGQPYFWTTVTLRPPCQVDPSLGPVLIYSQGSIDIGNANGNSGVVNPPLLSSAQCSSVASNSLTDFKNNPSSNYCPSWSANLRLFQLSGVSGNAANIYLRNHVQFWGVIDAPSGCTQCGANGPQGEVWGAIITHDFNANAQINLHYDDSLGKIGTGRFATTNWREEPLP